jgi:tungstate transport system ATP-binding protein
MEHFAMAGKGMNPIGPTAASDSVPVFFLEGVRFSYDTEPVLEIPELEISRDRITVFIGENGSGKTTLLKLLNGLLKPGSGKIVYDGEPLREEALKRFRSKSVLVHQDPYLFSGSVFANVAYGLKIRNLDHGIIRRRVAETLDMLDCAGFEKRRASDLSGGERQRVAIARALALGPEVLFLDEPTANIDPAFVPALEDLLGGLKDRGTTILVSSHHLPFAYRTGDVLWKIEGGSPFPVPENVLSGKVSGRDDYFIYFETSGKTLKCPSLKGDFTTAVISYDDIILSRDAVVSSAQNCFTGTVVSVYHKERSAHVTLDCGFTLRSEISEYSHKELDIRPGKRYSVVFKSSAVELY